jgi:hypothetical protein
MECDWELELGGDAAVIDANWQGFVDLRFTPASAATFPETEQLTALADVLMRLNSPSSPVWTAKCDFWVVDQIDPDELDAPPELAACAVACYIDLLPALAHPWPTAESAIAWCKQQCEPLRLHQLRCCRADLIVRHAMISPDRLDVGVTAYFTACAPTPVDAAHNLSTALIAFTDSMPHALSPTPANSKQK